MLDCTCLLFTGEDDVINIPLSDRALVFSGDSKVMRSAVISGGSIHKILLVAHTVNKIHMIPVLLTIYHLC